MLVVVGTGINGPAHLTQETRAWITNADAVYYVVADAVTENYILSIAPKATNLYHHYQVGRPRIETYRDMSDDILAEVRKEKLVVAIFYGHPGVFVTPSHDVVLRAKAEGYEAKMLPAISAEDCLIADLNLDPARQGCLTFEATDFLVNKRPMDPRSLLIIWQIGVIGNLAYRPEFENPYMGILCDRLEEAYPPSHTVAVYEASQFAVCDPVIHRVTIAELRHTKVSSISTLAVPPAVPTYSDREIMAVMGIAEPA